MSTEPNTGIRDIRPPCSWQLPKIPERSLTACFFIQYDYKIEFGPRRQDPEPFGIQLAKGPRSVAVTRKFADFAMTGEICHQFLNWLQVGIQKKRYSILNFKSN